MFAPLTDTELRGDELPLGHVAWVDSDGNELLGSDSSSTASTGYPMAGVQVSLRDGSGAEIARTLTDRRGNYVFDDLPMGQYTVVFTAPSSEITDIAERSAVITPPAPIDVMLDEGFALTPIQTWTVSPTGWGDRASVLRVAGTLG
jgi:hypothetical protein